MQARRGFEALSQFWNEEDMDDLEIFSGMNVRHPLGHKFPAGSLDRFSGRLPSAPLGFPQKQA